MRPSTLANYMKRIKSIRTLAPGKSLAWIMKQPSLMIEAIRRKHPTDNATVGNYLTSMTKLFSTNVHMTVRYTQHYKKWLIALKEERLKEIDRYKKSEPSEKQKKLLIPYDMVYNKYEELKKLDLKKDDKRANLEFLLFAVFIHIRPKRADFGNVKLLQDHPPDKTLYNYMVINDRQPQFVLNIYKTSFKHHQIVEDIPNELNDIIHRSIKCFPRKYLFVDNHQEPYILNHSYAEFVRRTFKKYLGKSVGVTMWRRIRNFKILKFDAMSYDELEHEADLMGHSVMQQFLIYRMKKPL